MKIDSEIYFWKYTGQNASSVIQSNKLLREDYLPEVIMQSLRRNEIEGCVAIVANPQEVETRFLSELAGTHPIIRAVVGWTDFQAPKAVEKLQTLQNYSPIRGYQIDLEHQPLPGPEIMETLQQLKYSLDITLSPKTDLNHLLHWINMYPEQAIALQHCGNPDASKPPAEIWTKCMIELSKFTNVYCKVCGLFERGSLKSWKSADFYPYLEILFKNFKIENLMYGSDWPFILLSGSYIQWKSLLEKFLESVVIEDKEKFFGENAVRFYRI